MATCRDCLHHSLCDYNTNISGNGKVRMVYAEGADIKCSFFENRADIVPKGEAESLTLELNAMRGAANSYKMHYNNLAKEIFEEIENLFFKNGVFIHIQSYNQLKKKYTEEGAKSK